VAERQATVLHGVALDARHAIAMPFAMPSRADLDGNGVVDAVDLALLFLALAVPIGQIARFEPRTSNWTEL
jgi:hypothetical protein